MEKVVRAVGEFGMSDDELHGAKIKLEQMEDWKKMVTGADKRTAAAGIPDVAEVKGELGKVAEKRSMFEC